jgi:hypothetical protein
MAKKINNKTTDLKIGSVLKVINIKENTPYVLNKFYNITDGDGVGALFVGGSNIEFTMHELGEYFEHIATLEDIENLEHKALILKETFEQLKIMSESAEEKISNEALIKETIDFLIQDEVYQGDEVELRFICNNMDITMVEKCSCCGKVLFPDDECYEDNLNDGAALCNHCSVYDDDRDMYIKSVRQDVVEKLTGYKFSPHVGNVGSALEDFNHYLKNNELKFGVNEPESKKNFTNFIIDNTELNFCDCCGLIEKSDDLAWTEGQFFEDEKVAIDFINTTYSNFAAICQNCLNKFISRTKLSLHEIVQRIKENKMVYRVGDLVILKNVVLKSNNIFAYIESLDEATQTYKLKGFENVVIKEEDLFDIANEAYIIEYNEFIKNKHVEKVDDLSDFANDNKEHTIDMLVEKFGFKDEFIEHLKTNDLPFERLVNKSKVSDELDEILIVKNELLEYIFCQDDDNGIVIPTYNELTEVDDYQSNWKLTEEYGDYSLSTLVYLVNEESSKFFSIKKVLNGHKENFHKTKKYGLRTYAEYGAPIEVVLELQELYNIYENGVKNPDLELLLLQDSRSTQDFSSIEILVQDEIKYDELSLHLKSKLDIEHNAEVDNLVEAIKEAKADNQTILHVYDC